MDIIESILDAVDVVTSRNERSGTHTFTVSAPLCMPIRGVYDELYAVGIRGKWQPYTDIRYPQAARLTVSQKQAKYASLLLWKLSGQWPEGLRIDSDPHKRKSLAAIRRNGWKMPTPWKDKDKPWAQAGCPQSRR